ncbi:MAG: Nucleoporin nup84 [Pycnora praestabilis]|nr:MAG: Nucleoporin nup84 [Pycnora praestabilis]
MAPLGRSSFSSKLDGFRVSARQNLRDDTWEFPSSEARSEDSHEESESAIVDGDQGEASEFEAMDTNTSAPLLLMSGNVERALHPLRAMADRVGHEVEQFAEKLDKFNPSRQHNPHQKRKTAFDLVTSYHNIARDSVKRLRKEHAPAQQRQLNNSWKRRVHDFQVATMGQESEGGGSDDDEEGGESSCRISETNVGDLVHWQQEEHTWDLMEIMLGIEFPDPAVDTAMEKEKKVESIGSINRYSSESKIWQRFLVEDDLANERQLILKWLNNTAEDTGGNIDMIVEQLETGAERGTGLWAHGWLHTKEAIKAQKRLRTWPQALDPTSPGINTSLLNSDKTEGLVTQLDPDAVIRQNRVLEKQDQYFERAIWLACWEMLRRGKGPAVIRDWCRERVEGWRAVSMHGGMAAWDTALDGMRDISNQDTIWNEEAIDEGGQNSRSKIYGNRSRALWRRMCFAVARSGGTDEYEKAVYGLLSGDVESVEKVCRSWDDYLYAHYNSLLLSQFDNYMQERYPDRLSSMMAQKFGVFDSVQFHGEPETVGQRLVERLKTHDITKNDAKQVMKMVQGTLIAKQFGEFAYQQGLALSKFANVTKQSKIIAPMPDINLDPTTAYISSEDFRSLRVITHILIIFQEFGLQIGHGSRRMAVENIIVAYIDFLRLAGKLDMLPLYASRLSAERSIITLGRVLIDITNPRERAQQIVLMRGLDIDVAKVLNMQLRHILSDSKYKDNTKVDFARLSILEDARHMGRQIRKDFIGQHLTDDEDLLIRSYEWYMHLEGHWIETFSIGSMLYKRFLSLGRLAAARDLSRRVPFSEMSREKTAPLLGKKVDVSRSVEGSEDEDDGEYDDSTAAPSRTRQASKQRRRASSAAREIVQRDVLTQQARTYIELEALVFALDALQAWRNTSDQYFLSMKADARGVKTTKSQVQRNMDEIVATVEPLLQGWLLQPMDDTEASDFQKIRNNYLPEVILAYNSVLHGAGHFLSRDNLLHCMSLATRIAVEGSDLAECFTATGRMSELVDAFAMSSKAILRANEKAGGKISKRKKRAGNGETLELWQIG